MNCGLRKPDAGPLFPSHPSDVAMQPAESKLSHILKALRYAYQALGEPWNFATSVTL